jgi:hypothetical protein
MTRSLAVSANVAVLAIAVTPTTLTGAAVVESTAVTMIAGRLIELQASKILSQPPINGKRSRHKFFFKDVGSLRGEELALQSRKSRN